MFALQKICALLLVITIGISGCTTASNATKINQMAIGVLGEPSTFNPVLNNVATSFFEYTSEGLIGTNGKGEIEPALAESWQIEGNTITFTMRPNLKWSDGAPLTADDVEFTSTPKFPTTPKIASKLAKPRNFPPSKKSTIYTLLSLRPKHLPLHCVLIGG